MRILVISLLRLGDVLIASPALHGLRRKYPSAKIDLLVNQNFISLKSILPDVDELIPFDRDGLQDGLAEASCPLFESLDYLDEIINKLKSNQYDLVVNFTQNKLSGYLTSLIGAKEQIGLSLSANGQPSYSSSWFRYLNDYFAADIADRFHFTDIFYLGSGLPTGTNKFVFNESPVGKAEALNFFSSVGYASGPKVVVQALTSDIKKTLSRSKWVDALTQFQSFESDAHIFLLGAPNEAAELSLLQQELKDKGVRSDLAILSLDGALALLNVSDLLITGDTSIKHLASGTPISIFEIAIGSSDYKKTGVYKPGSLILKSNEPCSPCQHSAACHRESHLCASQIPSELIALAASKFLHHDWLALQVLAEEYSDCANLLKTEWAKFGLWMARHLTDRGTQREISDQLSRLAWKFLLEKEHLKPLAAYGSESLKLKEAFESDWHPDNQLRIKMSLEHIELTTLSSETRINKILSAISSKIKLFGSFDGVDFIDSELVKEIIKVESDLGLGKILSEKFNPKSASDFYQIRQLQNSLNDVFSHQQIKLKLIRSLRSQITENA